MPAIDKTIIRFASVLVAAKAMALIPAPALAQVGERSAAPTTVHQIAPIVRLQNLTWKQVADRLAEGSTTIIIPTGGTEQNGHHMILGKHNYIVRQAARAIALRHGNTLVAPVMAYVPEGDPSQKTGHMAYPGTISLSPSVFEQVLEQTARSLKTHGFKTIAFLGDSGGNQKPQARVAARLNARWADEGVRVIHLSDYYANNGGDELLLAKGETKTTIGTHAGIRDTSELMAVFPQGVDLANAVPDAHGVSGDPRRATKALGEQLLQAKIKAALAQLKHQMTSPQKTGHARDTQSPGIGTWLWRAIFG